VTVLVPKAEQPALPAVPASAHPSQRLAFLLIAVCISCKPAQPPPKPAAAGPQVPATVVTIRTTIQPEKKTYTHTIVIAGDLARSTGEHDTWRLFDTKAKTVTFVDDVERTIRTQAFPAIVQERSATNAAALPPHYPRAAFARSAEHRVIHGANAEKVTITSGAYTRELWIAEDPSIPRDLFAMMHASETPSSPLAPMMRDVDRELVSERGFPLVDRTTVPVGRGLLVVERTVIGIAQRDVPESLMAFPRGYEDRTNGATAQGPGKGARRKD
jgi:hypothetical protein